ncbi:hypothetical protein JQU17_03590 [Ponticoccus sp. SC2-23]|uniref:hypothetical protein n=1 Tax=Alexandriicola marinus TaxID=2081710 RepID=UPI000FD8049A|nr:hypothetical protein [Alexandriicola marinus]MBM1219269.1 hypothetical protein [Ponticoccus sp. SC6-9]MBM1223659.1 hypothetical protein [Ponticoccus sp. SC6-15]MBM1229082.1 hypothetical protein [Ponticoccus sp. SC6-38]MBM1232625.1 hypothetical protein [Ponticoccus sp. SC6-45]MBM1237425.1 hypothetical protein [Ponticoccus sp. SC6-49]MBM1241636.1 hypothetical protein [Ponticoccus sp. SC2-64]MBM1246149.1 hypothetical protein [Ponticoccus sp. SC6-42]MBM1250627.1 hypothetical protein [Pontico
MSEISEFESRITSALARIRRQVEALEEPGDDDVDTVPALRQKLDEERTVNAQLEERVRALKDRQETKIAELEAAVASGRTRMSELDHELQRLQQVNAELRAVAGEMSTALSEGVAEPELVNRAMMAELEALRAAHAADRAEMQAILAELEPILGGQN